MTPQEKAEALYNDYLTTTRFTMEDCSWSYRGDSYEFCIRKTAKWLCLKSVDEILELVMKSREDYKRTSQLVTVFKDVESFNENLIHTRKELDDYAIQKALYWQEVKNEIEKL